MSRKILLLSHQAPYFPGPGAETRAFCLAKVLKQYFDIEFLLPDYGPMYAHHYESLGAIGDVQLFQVERVWKRLEWRLYKTRMRLEQTQLFKALNATPEMLRSTHDFLHPLMVRMRQINWQHFDLFHVIHPHLAEALKYTPIPVPKTLDWVDERTIVLRRQLGSTSSFLNRIAVSREIAVIERYQREIISMFDTSFVASEVDADRLEQGTGGKRPLVVPNAVDTDYFHNPATDRPFDNILVFTGHMGYQPNIDAVLYFVRQILPAIRNQIPDVRLIIVGMQPPVAIIALQDELSGTVEVTGEIPDVRPYITKGALSIAPLLSGGGTRLKLLEAMAMHRPVVTTSVGCEGLAVKDNYHVLVRDDAAGFASAVIQALKDRSLWNRLTAEGYRLVTSEYSWAKAAEPIIESWERLTAKRLPAKTQLEQTNDTTPDRSGLARNRP